MLRLITNRLAPGEELPPPTTPLTRDWLYDIQEWHALELQMLQEPTD